MRRPDPILERLTRLHPKSIDLTLDRVRRLLARLGDPHRALPPVIHVAGTNGKGSVCAYLRAALEAAGQRVHVYTSPHLVRFNERIRLAGRLIDDDALAALLDEVEVANAEAPITFFEVTTAAALLAFARTPADALVLEVGLGGRLDATNVVERPEVTVITPVSMDHESFLGNTLPEIAGEKAGILKPGVPAVIGPQAIPAAQVIEQRALALAAPMHRHGVGWTIRETEAGMRYAGARWRLDLPRPGLAGRHQIANAGTAVAALEMFQSIPVPPEAIAAGLTGVEWPARLQRLARGRLARRIPAEAELWLDGGHNPAAGEALAEVAAGWSDRPLHLVIGMLQTKDARGFLKPLAPHAGLVRTVTIPGAPAAVAAETLAERAREAGLEAAPAASVGAALDEIAAAAPGRSRILICGSLYLAGTVLAENC